jgi:hypothetical protein
MITNTLRLREDLAAKKVYLEKFENGAWTVKATFIDAATGEQGFFGDLRVSKATPALRLSGTETGAKDLSIRENAGRLEVYDNVALAVLGQIVYKLEIPVPLGFIPTGLATDATGVKFEAKQYVVSAELLACAKAAYFESDLQQLTGGTVALELYDYTAAAVRASLSLSATSKGTRSADILASLVSGNPVGVRFNVTAAGAAGSLGGGCSPVLILVLGVS